MGRRAGPDIRADVNGRLIGAAIGGVLVHPAHNLHYVGGTYFWAGLMPMALIGIARAFEIDFTPYLSPFWLVKAIDWIMDRFAGEPAPQNCSSVPPGNSLDPIPLP